METVMKDYVKPTIEVLKKQIEKSIADTGSSDKQNVHKLGFIHTLSPSHIVSIAGSTDDS